MGNIGGAPLLPETYESPDPRTFCEYENGVHFVTEPDAESVIHVAKEGVGAEKPVTLFHLFEQAVLKCGDTPALAVEVPENGQFTNAWTFWTWSNVQNDSLKFARSLVKLGVQRFEAVSILGFNTPHWLISHFGAIHAGGKGVGIYQTNKPEAVQYIVDHSGSRVIVVEDEVQLEKVRVVYKDLPKLLCVVVYRPADPKAIEEGKLAFDIPVYSWDDFLVLGSQDDQEVKELQSEVDNRIRDTRPGHACSLIYTSGTTGPPKAVMISHDNCTWTAKTVLYNLDEVVHMEHVKGVSYLPLSHIAAQLSDVYAPLLAASMGVKATVYFARPDALKGSLGQTLKAVHPTMFFGVPRVWEKMAEKMQQVASQTEGVKRKVAKWSKEKQAIAFENEQVGGTGKVPFGHSVASKVLSKVRVALGFEKCTYLLTGAAPIQPQTLRYFGSLGMPILELYGMSECTGPQTVSKLKYHKIGSCGPSLQGCEMKIEHDPNRDKPGEGEICYRGRHIMMGYMKNPEKSRETIDPDGWLHSGDVGRVDEGGLLYITGRIKELIITAGGENIAPVPIEDRVLEELPALSGAMLVGDKRKYNVILVTLRCRPQEDDPSQFTEFLEGKALEVNPEVTTVSQAQKDPAWAAYIQAGLDKANDVAVSRAQRVQKFAILPNNFTVAGNELTPTMKLKRTIVAQKYDDLIEGMYGE